MTRAQGPSPYLARKSEREKKTGASPKGMPHAAKRCPMHKSPRWSAREARHQSLDVRAPRLCAPRAGHGTLRRVLTRHPGASGAPPSPFGGMEMMQRDPRTRRGDEKGKKEW